jgi:hypothetical protein
VVDVDRDVDDIADRARMRVARRFDQVSIHRARRCRGSGPSGPRDPSGPHPATLEVRVLTIGSGHRREWVAQETVELHDRGAFGGERLDEREAGGRGEAGSDHQQEQADEDRGPAWNREVLHGTPLLMQHCGIQTWGR